MTHLTDTESPLISGHHVKAICGEYVPNAQWFFAFDGEVCGKSIKDLLADVNTIGLCRKRLNAQFTGRYLSGVRESKPA